MNDDEHELIRANLNKMMAETMKLSADTAKINAEIRFYPMVAAGGLVVAILGATITLGAVIVKLVR